MVGTIVDPKFETLLDYLRRERAFDFTGYKRSTLMRRVQKRMQEVQIAGYGDYMDYLEVHPEEFTHLFNTILINVTAFFRDESAWDYLAKEVLPRLLADKQADGMIRVWSAGCASGEEAYTLAMLLCEALGAEAFARQVKIYATDVDEEALVQARQGSYSSKDLQPVRASWWWTNRCRWSSGTARPRTCGACAPMRCRASRSCRWTSACRSSSSPWQPSCQETPVMTSWCWSPPTAAGGPSGATSPAPPTWIRRAAGRAWC